jgi:hypothetical protein
MRTRLSALPIPDEVRELMIAHRQSGLHQTYDLHRYRDEKRRGFELWADQLVRIVEPPPATIRQFSGLGNDSTQLQFTAAIQPGNSGGALVDRGGALVGVVASKLSDTVALKGGGFVSQGVNFAIRKEIAIAFLQAHGVSLEPSEDATYTTVADIAQRGQKSVAPIVCRS